MPATQNIAESLVRENIIRAVSDVFKTMLGYDAVLSPAPAPGACAPAQSPPTPQVVGTVGFIGDANGLIYLYLEEEFAIRCTADMLGFTEQELAGAEADSVNDAIGELTNMVVGSFKNGLCDAGFPCKLTIPSILRGQSFSVEPMSSAQRHVYTFACRGRRLSADILLKYED